MKHSAIVTLFASMVLPFAAHAANPQYANACATQMTEKHITDAASAKKVCTCVVDEQSKITQAQKNELDTWVKSGKDVRQNKTFQTISARMKACGNGVKFNKARP